MGTGRFFSRAFCAIVAALLLAASSLYAIDSPQNQKKKDKNVRKDVMSFDGGILFETDGDLSTITCFQLAGRATAEHFFDDFKRIDDDSGTEYRSAQEVVKDFPDELHVSFVIYDIPCKGQMKGPGPRAYLTEEMMKSLRFSFYWKRGIELRHIDNLKAESAAAELVKPYNSESQEELPKRYRWYLTFDIPSTGVPLTDKLVLIIRKPDGHTAARVAARL
jgi:hypothetical protein